MTELEKLNAKADISNQEPKKEEAIWDILSLYKTKRVALIQATLFVLEIRIF